MSMGRRLSLRGVCKQRSKKRRLSQRGRQEQRTAYLCLIPAFAGLIFLTYLPLVAVFGISFFNWSNGGNPYGLLFSGGGLCLLAVAVLWGQYSFVLLPSLDLPLGAILRNGWSLAFLGGPSSLGILVLEAAGVLFLVLLSPISLGIALFFDVAFVQYTVCFLVNFPLQKWILEPFRRSQQESKL